MTGAAAGVIGGRDWDYKYAYVDPTMDTPEEEDVVFFLLPYKPKEPCPSVGEAGQDARTVMVSAPRQKKLVKLRAGTGRNLVFHEDKRGEPVATVAKVGKIQLTDVTSTRVRGRIFGSHDKGNWVSGTFSAVVCDFRKDPVR